MKKEPAHFNSDILQNMYSYPVKLLGCKCTSALLILLITLILLLVWQSTLGDNAIMFISSTSATISGDVSFHELHYKHLQRRIPQCIIIGARKAGTRALLGFLDLHPNIITNKNEMHFFDRDENYSLGLEWYRNQMPLTLPNQLTIEKTPAYFHTPGVVERIHLMNSSIRLLLIVRDPVVRAVSDWYQLDRKRLRADKPSIPFERLAIGKDGSVNASYDVLQRSMYSVHYKRWTKLFSPRQIHVVDGDAFIEDPASELEKVERFLKLPQYFTQDMFVRNESKGFYCVVRTTDDVRTTDVVGTADVVKCLNESKGRQHPPIDQKVLRKLRAFFAKYNQRFYKFTDSSFNWNDNHSKHKRSHADSN